MWKADWLNVLAVSPPEFEEVFLSNEQRMSSVNSNIPYALFATLALTLERVKKGTLNILNWQDPQGINESVFLMHHWQEWQTIIKERILKYSPDVVLLSTFAMNFPGAIAVAKLVQQLSPETLIALGGRHINETFWGNIGEWSKFESIGEHAEANPLCLMNSWTIPPIFDLFISWEWRDIIPSLLGEIQTRKKDPLFRPRNMVKNLSCLKNTPGYWVIGSLQADDTIRYTRPEVYQPSYARSDHSPYVYLWPVGSPWTIFSGSDWTAHVHSDSRWIPGNSCTQNCSFCSEASGKQKILAPHELDAWETLFRRFREIVEVGNWAYKKSSLFVEDSILCGWHWWAIEYFCELMEQAPPEMLPTEWWCQFTIPMIVHARWRACIQRLQKVGLSYVYFGLESAKPSIAAQIAKARWSQEWSSQAEKAIEFLTETGVKVGTSNIFCMGETQTDRMEQLKLIKSWQEKYRWNPCVYSLNLQTVHPGEWWPDYMGKKYDYTEWSLDVAHPRSPILQELFWEASMRHLRYPDELPTLAELREIRGFLNTLKNAV